MAKRLPPWWVYLILSVGSFIAAALYFGRASAVGDPTRKVVTGFIFLGLAVFWVIGAYLTRRESHSVH